MISPQLYYSMNIEGKKPEEIEIAIKHLRKEMSLLESNIKNDIKCYTKPDFQTQLHHNKEILKYIKKRLKEQ